METPQLYIDLILLMVQRISSSVKVSLWISLKFLIRVDFPALAGPNTSILLSNFRSVVPLDFFPGLFSLVLLLNLRYGLTDGGSFWFASRLQLSCPKQTTLLDFTLFQKKYSWVRNKHSPTLINFLFFFQGLRPYSGLHRAYFSSISIRYKWGYAYSFCQIFQGLRLFQTLD